MTCSSFKQLSKYDKGRDFRRYPDDITIGMRNFLFICTIDLLCYLLCYYTHLRNLLYRYAQAYILCKYYANMYNVSLPVDAFNCVNRRYYCEQFLLAVINCLQ